MNKEDLKDGVFYKLVLSYIDDKEGCILQYNSQDENSCRGYWTGVWNLGLSFPYYVDMMAEATYEELEALGTQHRPYSKYLQYGLGTAKTNPNVGKDMPYVGFGMDPLVKPKRGTIYTLKDLAKGRVAVVNDGTPEEVFKVLRIAFPKDDDVTYVKEFEAVYYKEAKFFCKSQTDNDRWTLEDEYEVEMPKQSAKVFLKEIEYSTKLVGDLISDNQVLCIKTPEQGNYEAQEVAYKDLMREFSTGATRNLSDDKFDFEGFLSPLALEEFAKYMHKHRLQADGKLRDSDNWQKGIELNSYMSSMWRHFFDTWKNYRGLETPEDQVTNLCAVMFNAQGMLHELLKTK